MWTLLRDFARFLGREKTWWLAPLILLRILLGAVVVFSARSVVALFVYPVILRFEPRPPLPTSAAPRARAPTTDSPHGALATSRLLVCN